MKDKQINRREFMKHSSRTAAVLAASSLQVGASPRTVIVIGAGLAGLVAAYELTRAGHDVTILEARMRAGGRVLTLREPFADGLYAEAGGARIAEDHDLTRDYAQKFGLTLDPFPQLNLHAIYYLRGQRIRSKPGVQIDWPLQLTAEERELGISGMMEKYVLSLVKEADAVKLKEWPPVSLERYDQITFAELLRQRGASPAAITLLGLGFYDLWGDGIDSYSALLMLRQTMLQPKNTFEIKGGNDLLPAAFAARHKEKIHYGAPVVKISQQARGVRVTFSRAGTHRAISADYLICAIPFSVLRQIEVTPRFSADKRRAIEELPYISVTRVFLQSRSRFWVQEGLGGFAATDLPILNTGHVTLAQPGTRGILESFTTGPRAREVSAMKESERVDFTLEQMEKVYPGMRENFEGGSSICWDAERWSRGASIWFKPGQMTSLLPHIGRPEGRVHFAGEHASRWPGTMQGALASGVRAAREINERA